MNNYGGHRANWRNEYATYRTDPRFEAALQELIGTSAADGSQLSPTLLVLIGLPGSGKTRMSSDISSSASCFLL